MDNRRNFYRVLHVQPDAPAEIIKTSYRTMMQRMKMHPDLGGDHGTATIINEAYATLMDADKRAAYDQTLSAPAEEFAEHAEQAERAAAEPQNEADRCLFCAAIYPPQNLDHLSNCGNCGSPLLRIDAQCHDNDARRAVARMPKSFALNFVTEWPSNQLKYGKALDLSVNGLRFMCNEFLPAGALISIESDICSSVAEVRSCAPASPDSPAQFEAGVRFITLSFHRTQGGFVSITA